MNMRTRSFAVFVSLLLFAFLPLLRCAILLCSCLVPLLVFFYPDPLWSSHFFGPSWCPVCFPFRFCLGALFSIVCPPFSFALCVAPAFVGLSWCTVVASLSLSSTLFCSLLSSLLCFCSALACHRWRVTAALQSSR